MNFTSLPTVFFGCLALALLCETGCSRHGFVETPHPGELRFAVQSDVRTLNPLLSTNTTDGTIMRLMFEPLLSADRRGRPVPMLAREVPTLENGGISRDGLTVTYHLRPDAKWSDATPVTSRDVKWSYEAVMNPRNDVISRNGYDQVERVDTPGATVVIVHLKRRFAPFVNEFFAESDTPYPVAPAHVLSHYSDINRVPFNSAPRVSDGPFTFVRLVHGDRLEFAANPHFFMGRPKLDKILVRVIPDENTEVNALRTRDVDWIFQASESTYSRVKNISGVQPHWVDLNGYEYLTLNTQSPNLSDVRVRRAVAHAIDRASLIRTLTFGNESSALEDQPRFLWAFTGDVQQYAYDPQASMNLLRDAGWSRGTDGIWRKGGRPLHLTLVTNGSNATRRNESVQIQAMLAKAGIDAGVKYYPGDILFAPAGSGGILENGKFDVALAGWSAGIDPDDSSQFMCRNVAPNGFGFARYCSAEMDRLQNEALSTYDIAARKKAYAGIQQLLARDVPAIFLWYTRQFEPAYADFKELDPNPVTDSWNAWEWTR